MVIRTILCFLTGLWASVASAQDAQLYDPAPPPDSAYLRFIHAHSEGEKWQPTAQGRTFSKLSYGEISPYYLFKQSSHSVSVAGQEKELTLEAGAFYSLALTAQGTAFYPDEPVDDPAKARLYFYNLSAVPLASLYAPEHETDIFTDVKSGKAESREINALKLKTQLRHAESLIAEPQEVMLKRRRGFSLVLMGQKEPYRVVVVENEIAR